MKKKILFIALVISCLFITVWCNFKKIENSTQDIDNSKMENNESNTNNSNEVVNLVKVTINGKEYTMQLEDNDTAKSFVNLLPQEFSMNELNGNEKYIYLDNALPTSSFNPKRINAGDVMLYGNNCLVIFYESFDTSYSYTKIGHINNLPNLGNEIINIKIEN